MVKDTLTPKEITWMQNAAYQIGVQSTMLSQIALSDLLSERTKKELMNAAAVLTGVSARISRIEIISNRTEIEHWED